MKYRGEMMFEGRIVKAANYPSAKHPNHVVRSLLTSADFIPEHANIYVMNENGERWSYILKRGSVRMIGKSYETLSKDQIDTVFAGNIKIKDAEVV